MDTPQPQYGQFRPDDQELTQPCPTHPDRYTAIRCQRCERPVCVDCAQPAPVGVQCPQCRRVHSQEARAIADSNALFSGLQRPVLVTNLIIGTCLVVFVATTLVPSLLAYFGFVPAFSIIQPWRFLTTAFLHANLPHILLNMFALWQMGRFVETALGHLRFAALYLLSALGASVFVLVWGAFVDHELLRTNTVGASGAVFGTFAAVFIIQRRLGLNTVSIGALLAINFVWGLFVPNISWQGHLGGMLTGAAVATGFFAVATRVKRRRQEIFQSGGTSALAKAPTGRVGDWLVIGLTLVVLVAIVFATVWVVT